MASTHKSLRSGTANKRPTTAIADGQIALNTNTTSPGLFFKDSTGATIIKIGPVHVGTTAPNATPASGGSSGNSSGEVWLDTSLTPNGVKIWNGSAWVNVTPAGSTTVQGLLELATNAETQTGTDPDRAVTPAGLQSKVSDSTSTTSSTTIASSTAVKAAYDLANAALPKSGGIITGNLEIGTTGSLSFEGSTADAFETTIAVTNPTADRTITLPDQTGNFLVSGNASIVNADVNASAAIAGTKISPDFGSQNTTTTGTSTAASFIPTSSSVPTNGVYLPAANSVAVATNGTGRLFVDASGRIGVGRTPVAYGSYNVLDLAGSAGSIQKWVHTGSTVELQAYASATLTAIGSATNHPFVIVTNDAERLRITAAGLVGVGTSAPSGNLDVRGVSGTSIIRAVGADTNGNADAEIFSTGTTGNSRLYFSDTAAQSGSIIYSHSTNSFSLATNATTAVTIDSSQRVGVGTASPATALHVSAAGSTPATFTTTGADLYLRLQNSVSTGGYVGYNSNALTLWTTDVERARIDSSGRVGIGTSAPTENLTIYGASSRFAVTGGSGSSAILLGNQNSGGANNPSVIEAANGALYFGGGNSWSGGGTFDYTMTLTNDNKVGIGVTSPVAKLHVQSDVGGISEGLRLSNESTFATGGRGIQLTFRGTGGGLLGTITGTTNTAADNQGTLSFAANGATGLLSFNTNGSERARIDSSGRLLVGTSSSLDVNAGLQIAVNSSFSDFYPLQVFHFDSTDDTQGPTTIYTRSKSDTIGTVSAVNVNDGLGTILFRGAGTSAYVNGALIKAEVESGTVSNTSMPSRLVFSTTADGASSPTERMRITSGGYFKASNAGTYGGVAGTYHELRNNVGSGTLVLQMANTSATGNGVQIDINSDATSYAYLIGYSTSAAANRIIIWSNGNVVNTNNSYGAISDLKLKENIVDANSQWDDLKALQVRNYNFKEGQTHTQIGLVAQEVELISPGLVTESPDRDEDGNDLGTVTKSVNYSVLYMKAVKALQEAMERIEQLEQRLNDAGIN